MGVVHRRPLWYTDTMKSRDFLLGILACSFAAGLNSAPAQAGEPILVPEFTPELISDLIFASLIRQSAEEALNRAGHVVLNENAVSPVVGAGSMDGCYDVEGCPTAQLKQLPARIAVVVRIRRVGPQVEADIRVYEQTGDAPLQESVFPIGEGDGEALGRHISDLVEELVDLMGPADARDLIAAAKLVNDAETRAQEPPPVETTPETVSTPTVTDPPVTRPPIRPPDLTTPLGLRRALEGTPYRERHLTGAKQHFIDSGRDIRSWAARNSPHAGRVFVELRGGLGVGDVSRVAQVRTALRSDGSDIWFREGPEVGEAPRGGVQVGYAPTAWFDSGLVVSLQYGRRTLDSGWTDVDGTSEVSQDSVDAVQVELQARARAYPVWLGPVKPYVAAGVSTRFFDDWRIREVEGVEYAQPPGGVVPGVVTAGGLMFDVGPLFGAFVEGSYTAYFGSRSYAVQPANLTPPPSAPTVIDGNRLLLGAVGGVQFRL